MRRSVRSIFKNVHPNYITLFNLVIKYYAYMAAVSWDWKGLLWLGTFKDSWIVWMVELRKFEKCSALGHALNKYQPDLALLYNITQTDIYGTSLISAGLQHRSYC